MDNFELQSSSFTAALPKASFVSNLVYQVEAMLKKPHIDADLSEVLERFIQNIKDSDKYLDNGIFNIKFAEAALLLQSSVQLYGKKVDLLWDRVFDYQNQVIALERESAKREEAEVLARERQSRYKRKRKIEETREQASVNELLQLCSSIQNASLTPCENLQKTWTYAQLKERNYYDDIIPVDNCFRSSKYTITSAVHSDSENPISLHKMKLHGTVFELSQEYPVFVGRCLGKNPLNVMHFYENDEILQDVIVNEKVDCIEVEKLYRDKYKNYFSEHLAQKTCPLLPENYSTLCPRRLITHVKRLSGDVLQQYLKKDPTLMSAKIKRASSTVPSLNAEEFNDSGFFDYTAEVDESVCDTNPNSSEQSEHVCDTNSLEKEVQGSATEIVNTCGSETIIEEIVECNKRDNKKCATRKLSEDNSKRKRTLHLEAQELPKRKKVKIAQVRPKIRLTAALDVFEEFALRNYEAEEGETCFERPHLENTKERFENKQQQTKNLDHVNTDIGNSLSDDDDDNNDTEPVSSENVAGAEKPLKRAASPVLNQNTTSLSPSILKRIEEERRQREKVEEWKNFMSKKLDKAEKSDFDIHYYGEQIMNQISENENKKFKDVVSDKNAAEVSRYFMATLQLACTENVKLINSSAGCIANDCFEVKLLSRECYHKNLANYMAPSEETFNKRLAKVRAHSYKR